MTLNESHISEKQPEGRELSGGQRDREHNRERWEDASRGARSRGRGLGQPQGRRVERHLGQGQIARLQLRGRVGAAAPNAQPPAAQLVLANLLDVVALGRGRPCRGQPQDALQSEEAVAKVLRGGGASHFRQPYRRRHGVCPAA